MSCSYSVIIPTLNAEKEIVSLLDAIKKQSPAPAKILVVDSKSDDRTRELAAVNGAELLIVSRAEFDHGGTRDLALRHTDTPYVIFLTQDAMPVDENSMARLLAPMLENPDVAIVGGRQQAYPHASSAEKLVRAHNYPCISRVWGSEQIKELGVRAYLISDVFAAYRRDAYEKVGGFDRPILTNEDMLITQKLLDAGYQAAYAADAVVLHSHDFTLEQQYRRNYIIGRTMVRYEERFQNVEELGEGFSLAKNVLLQLLKGGEVFGFFHFGFDCAARLLGNRKGRADERKDKKRQV